MHDLTARIHAFVVQNFMFGDDSGRLQPDTSFVQTGIIDSTGVLELVAFLEDTFDLQIPDDEMTLDNLDSVARASAYIARKKGTGPA